MRAPRRRAPSTGTDIPSRSPYPPSSPAARKLVLAWAAVASRALGLAVMAVLGWQILHRDLDFHASSSALRFMHGIDLVIHEAGHAFALILPRFFSVLAGSAFQVLLPAVCALIFLHQSQLASFAVALFWTGESVTDVAIYMADARAQALPLIGGHAPVHDWNYLLGQLHLLGWTPSLARLTLGVGILLIVVALAIVANETHRAWLRAGRA